MALAKIRDKQHPMKHALLIIDVQQALCSGAEAAFDIDRVVDRINSVSTEISQCAVGFRLLVPTDSGTRFVPRSLEPGAGNLCTFRHAKLLVPVRMRCRVIASFCGGDAGLFARAATVWQSAMVPA